MRQYGCYYSISSRIFQSTHPYGCDVKCFFSLLLKLYFNPRTLTGATAVCLAQFLFVDISIHAPLRVRLNSVLGNFRQQLFQSTHPYGCDSDLFDLDFFIMISIHAPLRVRQCVTILTHYRLKFQSTHPYGCDN